MASPVSGSLWRFGATDGRVIAPHVMLRDDGRVVGHEHENEVFWQWQDDAIVLLSRDMRPTSLLRKVSQTRFEGPFLPAPENVHVLERTDITYPLAFRWHRACEEFVESVPIFLVHYRQPGAPYQPGQQVVFPERVLVEPDTTMPPGRFWTMGLHSYVADSFRGQASVGRYCSIARGCVVMGDQHPTSWISTHHVSYDPVYEHESQRLYGKPHRVLRHDHQREVGITLGHDVWVGEEVMFKAGVTIGNGAVIAARSVVTRDVEPFAIVGGVPARLIRRRFTDELIARIQKIAWWQYNYPDLPERWDDPETFLDDLERRIAEGRIAPYAPEPIDLGATLFRLSLAAQA